MSARRHFPATLPVILAVPRPVRPQQSASAADLVGDHTARVLIVARRPVPRRNLPALLLQFVRSLLPNRTITRPRMLVLLAASFAASRRHKIRPASVVHPNPVLVGSPGVSFLASRPAPLLHKLHTAPHIRLTEILPTIIRSAVKRLRWPASVAATVRPLVRLRHKLRPAAMVHPNSALIEPPRDAFIARRFAVLPDQIHIAACVRFTIMTRPILRRAAHNRLAATILPRPLKLHAEVRPASVIDPDPAFVISPRRSLLAR